MDVFDVVRTVLAVRSYQDQAIPPEVVRRIVEAGRLTASSQNGQPWHFIVVEERETIRQLASLARTGPYIAGAPLVIAIAIEDTVFAESDASRAVQSMILTAWSEGVGSNWVGFYGLDAIKPVLAIPGSLKLLSLLPLGYPARSTAKGKKNRKPLAQVASLNRFGQPFR